MALIKCVGKIELYNAHVGVVLVTVDEETGEVNGCLKSSLDPYTKLASRKEKVSCSGEYGSTT